MDPRGHKGTKYKQSETRLIYKEQLVLCPYYGKHIFQMESKVSRAAKKTVFEEKTIIPFFIMITKWNSMDSIWIYESFYNKFFVTMVERFTGKLWHLIL